MTCVITYTATASVVCHTGAKLIIIDSQPNSIEMDYDKVAKAINEKTKAIIPVDVGGIICDYDKIFSIVESKKNLFKPNTDLQKAFGRIIVLADAAHSFGATRNGKSNGSIADFTCFSFHAVKNLTTAEGGAVTWRNIPGIDNEEIFKKFELLSLHGQSKDALSKNKLGSWEYDIVEPYFKCNMTDIQAALGVSQLRRYDQILVKRKKIIEQYDNAFRPLGLSTLNHYSDKHSSSGHLYLTFLDKINFLSREEFIEKLTQKGIPSNVHYKPLPLLSAYKKLGYDIKDFPNAYNIYKKEVTLPLYTRLSDEQVNFIIDNVKDILSKKDIY